MNATERDKLEARLTTLLRDEEVASVPPDALESALARVAATGQRSRPFGFGEAIIRRQTRSGRRFGLVAVAAALAAVGGLVGSGGAPPIDHPVVQPLAETPPPSLSITATVDLAFHPYVISAGLGAAWVGGPIDEYKPAGVVARVDAMSRQLTRLPVDISSCSNFLDWARPAIAFGSVWMPDCGGDRILRLSPDTGEVEASFPAFLSPWDAPQDHLVAFDTDAAYIVTDTRVSAIDRVDVTKNAATPFRTIDEPTLDITIDGPTLWVTTDSSIAKVDLAARKVVATFPLEPRSGTDQHAAASVIAVDHGLWVNMGYQVVVAVDAASRRTTFDLGGPLRGFALANGKIWTIRDVFTLTSIDPERRVVVDALPIADGQGGLAADGDTLWFPDFAGQRLIEAVAP